MCPCPLEQRRLAGVVGGVPSELILEKLQHVESDLRPVNHRDRDRAIEGNHGRSIEPVELRIEAGHLGRLRVIRALGLGVYRRDRRLDLVSTGTAQPQRPLEQPLPLVDQASIPQLSILVVEQDDSLRPLARTPSRVLQPQQSGEPECLGLVGQEHGQHAGEANRLISELAAHQ